MCSAAVHHHSSVEAKVALFRSLFRGREDVYARRFVSRRTGKSGYAPACANEWVTGLCEKPRVKCADCRHRRFLPVTDTVIGNHLSGCDENAKDFVVGVYPMLEDESCFFLAADFDKAHWREDGAAFLDTCHGMGIPAAIERSRSGSGAHVWIFFEEAIPAAIARKLGSSILTMTMERRPGIGFDSYDRLFPNQDTLPRGGFGNLIALPLQKKARARGSSVFLDDRLVPYEDQWSYLSTVRKLRRGFVEEVVGDAERKERVLGVRLAPPDPDDALPWATPQSGGRLNAPVTGPLPGQLNIVLGSDVFIPKSALSSTLRIALVRLAAFQNPEFYKAQAMRLPTYGKPRIIGCAEDHSQHIGLPRGCLDDIMRLLGDLKIEPVLHDKRCQGEPLCVAFCGELRPEQQAAADAMLAHDTGVLDATTAFGKTVIAAWLIAQRSVNTLVLVHRRQLLEQWTERLSAFLNLPAKAIGHWGAGRKKLNGQIDVAIIQGLARRDDINECVAHYGHVIVDECHHLSAYSFEQVARKAKAKYLTGLSATVARKDGHHPIVLMQCGPIRHRVNAKAQADSRPFNHTVLVRPTAIQSLLCAEVDARFQFHQLYTELIADHERNQQICDDVVQAVRAGRSPIVLTERKGHLERLEELLSAKIRNVVVLRGGMGKRQHKAAMHQLEETPVDVERVILATGRYIGEGFDDARLDTLFLTLPVSWRGTIAQYAGRLHRLHDRKREVQIYDYADLNVPILARMYDRRCRGYESVGYKISLPASAVPGWPTKVSLPIDTQWKNDYAASVRRLIRDGVNENLANLFTHVAREVTPDAQGASRARSASEAFLFRRLESLPATAGRFQLNVSLPIPFDSLGSMEVDLLCEDMRIVLEIDGGQHLSDAEAYRRDRRKDVLLLEHGYFVLRFLAEDLGKRLDETLEAILRALAHRERLHR